jgi:hypothetical protein
MKITVELSEKTVGEICDLTGIRKKGPAIRRVCALRVNCLPRT